MSKDKKNDRINDINDFVDSIKTQESYKNSLIQKSNKIKEKYSKELEEYQIIDSKESLNKCKLGGYIRYINSNEELRYGGTVLKIYKPDGKDVTMILLQNSNNKRWSISWERNTIYYKNQVKKGDKIRSLFISMLDEK